MYCTFDEKDYFIDANLFDDLVIAYKVAIGYSGQVIENPSLATQRTAIQVCVGKAQGIFSCDDHVYAVANAVMKAV